MELVSEEERAKLRAWQRKRRERVHIVAIWCRDKEDAERIRHYIMFRMDLKRDGWPVVADVTRTRADLMGLMENLSEVPEVGPSIEEPGGGNYPYAGMEGYKLLGCPRCGSPQKVGATSCDECSWTSHDIYLTTKQGAEGEGE